MMTAGLQGNTKEHSQQKSTYNGALNVAQKQGLKLEYIWFGIPYRRCRRTRFYCA